MTFICTTFNRVRQRLGTLYGNGTLDSQATGVNAYGTITVTLPASPSTDQKIAVNNTGSGTVTITDGVTNWTLSAGQTAIMIWGGYSWGVFIGPSCTPDLPDTKDFGTIEYSGPTESQPAVPATTVEYETLGYTQCGGALRKTTTKTYSLRTVTNQYKSLGNITLAGGLSGTPGCPIPTFSSMNGVAGYGATITAARLVNYQLAWDSAASNYNLYDTGKASCYPITKNAFDNSASVKYSGHPTPNIPVILYSETTTSTNVTIYYIDIHEVWTYDIV